MTQLLQPSNQETLLPGLPTIGMEIPDLGDELYKTFLTLPKYPPKTEGTTSEYDDDVRIVSLL